MDYQYIALKIAAMVRSVGINRLKKEINDIIFLMIKKAL